MKKSLIVFLSLAVFFFFTQEVTHAESTRLSGKDRYETAVNISKKAGQQQIRLCWQLGIIFLTL